MDICGCLLFCLPPSCVASLLPLVVLAQFKLHKHNKEMKPTYIPVTFLGHNGEFYQSVRRGFLVTDVEHPDSKPLLNAKSQVVVSDDTSQRL